MAATLTKAAINGGAVSVHQVVGDERLDGARKTAALQAPGSPAIQDFLAQRQRQGHALFLGALDAVSVLVELEAGMTAFHNQAQELVKLVLLHRLFSTLNQTLHSENARQDQQMLINYIRKNKKAVLQDSKAPRRDKLAYRLLQLGLPFYRFAWLNYEKRKGE